MTTTTRTGVPSSEAVSRGYNFASTWEQVLFMNRNVCEVSDDHLLRNEEHLMNAPLTEQQQAAIIALSHAVVERPFPSKLSQENTSKENNALSISTKPGTVEESGEINSLLVNTNQFYKWFTDLEAAMKSETEEKYQQYVNTLTERIQTCDGILQQVDETLDLFNELQMQHQVVATKTKTLHDACDRMVIEKQRLIEFAESLRSKLNYFDELENVAASFYSSNTSVASENFLPQLKKLDDCISYVENNPQYAESNVYLLKFRQLQSRALGMIRAHVLSVLKSSTSQVCQLEHQLFDHFFPSTSEDISSLAPLVDPLCTYLYDTLRPKLIHEMNLDILCELVDILKIEVIGEQLNRRSESLAGIRPTLDRILADIHERLEQSDETESDPSSVNLLLDQSLDAVKTWYSPLEKTVSCLSRLYNCLEQAVFTGLAQEAVEFCSLSIQKASKLVAKRSSQMDGQLFLIKHLLILREQIAPFDIEFSVTHKELDFSHLLEHLRRILRGQTSLFDWSRSTSLARTFSPRVLESQIDAKKELEKNLKATCEEFIMSVTKSVVDPMLSFVTKVTAVKVALSSGAQNQKLESSMGKPLKDQAFATPDKVAEIVQKVNAAMQNELPRVMRKMKLYLQNPSTRTILFKPIKTNIIEAHEQVLSLLKKEYSEEEITSINMVSIQELQSQLNNLI
ncbi:hypothetical protein L1987_76206 [Smallanthus sonchifolius]|uniref:Uncharacterized protein n=1 Tax=Smallanthus sonchifolius TaxID=185202 RepID=A0ACB9A8U4_9ASTR|nr:hypothetical protein L1987_76206 [Smallanthus sonchifolius]